MGARENIEGSERGGEEREEREVSEERIDRLQADKYAWKRESGTVNDVGWV
jgi:hypothetical protein